jgi:hypothetical protein
MTERLKHALQALAAPAEVQLARYPTSTVRADELALEFDHALEVVLSTDNGLSPEQLSYLGALDQFLERMSRPDIRDRLWTGAAVRTSDQWASVREVAGEALRAFGWPIEPPPPSDDVYVPGRAV